MGALAELARRPLLYPRVAGVVVAAALRLVIDNLVSNAVKFSPVAGSVQIRCHRDGREVVLDVADSGPGVPPEDRDRIFEPFYQGATPQGSLVRGTGIGLSIVREFAEAHGGRVELVHGGTGGAHFRVRLPVAADSANSPG